MQHKKIEYDKKSHKKIIYKKTMVLYIKMMKYTKNGEYAKNVHDKDEHENTRMLILWRFRIARIFSSPMLIWDCASANVFRNSVIVPLVSPSICISFAWAPNTSSCRCSDTTSKSAHRCSKIDLAEAYSSWS